MNDTNTKQLKKGCVSHNAADGFSFRLAPKERWFFKSRVALFSPRSFPALYPCDFAHEVVLLPCVLEVNFLDRKPLTSSTMLIRRHIDNDCCGCAAFSMWNVTRRRLRVDV